MKSSTLCRVPNQTSGIKHLFFLKHGHITHQVFAFFPTFPYVFSYWIRKNGSLAVIVIIIPAVSSWPNHLTWLHQFDMLLRFLFLRRHLRITPISMDFVGGQRLTRHGCVQKSCWTHKHQNLTRLESRSIERAQGKAERWEDWRMGATVNNSTAWITKSLRVWASTGLMTEIWFTLFLGQTCTHTHTRTHTQEGGPVSLDNLLPAAEWAPGSAPGPIEWGENNARG